jgi:hypothetical protein
MTAAFGSPVEWWERSRRGSVTPGLCGSKGRWERS